MRSLKLILLSVFAALSVFCIVFYTSCSKDGCKGVTCMNNTTCSGGICNCSAKPGIGGTNCEIIYRRLYEYTYRGNGTADSGYIYTDNTLIFAEPIPADTNNYNKMSLRWVDAVRKQTVAFNIVLSNNLSTGSNFTTDTVVATDSSVYYGSGSVNGNVASITMTWIPLHAPTRIIYFNNFNKQ